MHSEVFDIVSNKDVVFLKFPAFETTGLVKHGFSTRMGGISTGIFSTMNLGFGRGDLDENVRKNFELFCDAVGVGPETMVHTLQVHEDCVERVTAADRGKGYLTKRLAGVDGLITNDPEVALITFYADCVPLFFLDPVKKAIGLSHAGWRGTVKGIGGKTVRRMQQEFGCNPEDILAAIGPSVGQCCYEVSEDVKIEVEKIVNHDIIDKIVKKQPASKYLLDLWALNRILLIDAGIKASHITTTDLCTCCNHEELYSHRATGGQRGNLAGILSLKPNFPSS